MISSVEAQLSTGSLALGTKTLAFQNKMIGKDSHCTVPSPKK